jgi:hypothetical protein
MNEVTCNGGVYLQCRTLTSLVQQARLEVIQARQVLSNTSGAARELRAQSLANWYAILHSRNARLRSFKQRYVLHCAWPQEVTIELVRSPQRTDWRAAIPFAIPLASPADA